MSPTTPGQIGSQDLPIRAVAFSSGGFDTAMQLGVVHALLTIQGKAPDAVVGVSAGAVNAVALAEILQAGFDPFLNPAWDDLDIAGRELLIEDRQRARVSRFRQIFEEYLNAPRELARAFAPDTLQVEARKPLVPLMLPIHDALERDGREREVLARQGLINLLNDLLGTRVSIATLTRFIRRALGVKAAGELPSRTGRLLTSGFELLRTWALIGVNLPRAAGLVPALLKPFLKLRARIRGRPSTAAQIIFSPRWAQGLRRGLRQIANVALLLVSWLVVTVTVFAAPYVIIRLGSGVLRILTWMGVAADPARLWLDAHAIPVGLILYLAIGVALALLIAGSGAWSQIVDFNRSSSGAVFRELGWQGLSLLLLLAALLLVPLVLSVLGVKLALGLAWADTVRPGFALAVNLYWAVLALLVLAGFLLRYRDPEDSYARRLLAQYDIADGLLNVHPLRQFFIRLFDPGYYGVRQMDDVVDRALRNDYTPSFQPTRDKLIRTYEAEGQSPPIAVGLMVANLAALRDPPKGTERSPDIVEIVPPDAKVVDGLLAATAVTPLFPPVPVRANLFIDGANVALEATRGLLKLMRQRTNAESTAIHLYSVSPLPFSSPSLREETGGDECEPPAYLSLLEVAYRALLLQRFRDATLERRLTELFTRAMPADKAVKEVDGTRFLRVWVTPVEPEQPLELNHRLTRCGTLEESRRLIAETVADGCRAALEVMIRKSMDPIAGPVLPCRTAVEKHLAERPAQWRLPLLADAEPQPTDPNPGPGLPEVCRHCRLSAQWAPPAVAGAKQPPPARALVVRPWEEIGPAWPHEYEEEVPLPDGAPERDAHFVKATTAYEEKSRQVLRGFRASFESTTDKRSSEQRIWPRTRPTGAGDERPLVSFLFSGGVFRGVYQLGTLNALAESGLTPDVIAGASVGSITAAMVAQAFTAAPGPDRDGRIGRLAATYLAVDRLILTDRFADFVRGLTLRSAETRFSLQQADRFFRRYDQAGAAAFDREARMVIAGLERLFWLSPFELKDLVKAFRLRRKRRIYDLLRAHTQEWLDRMGVGNQVLGAEPLELLIVEHVLQRLKGETWVDQRAIPFDRFLGGAGMYFLATTTNLTMGRLEVLGEQQLDQSGVSAFLLEGLLASSAFPGVFRPRWSWEVMPGSNARHQYIDGGVMDNLPLDAVAHFLRNAAEENLVALRPQVHGQAVPHLLFSASLEISPEPPSPEELQRFATEWPKVWARARQLKYNKKLELFAETQRALRAIHQAAPGPFQPVDLEVVMVRPRWLCSTFGFHPMLGFRRRQQMASIAHGCATGLLELARAARRPPQAGWAPGWGLDESNLPESPPPTDMDPIVPGAAPPGHCWFRPGVLCTFSAERLKETGLPQATINELTGIHAACGRRETHQARKE